MYQKLFNAFAATLLIVLSEEVLAYQQLEICENLRSTWVYYLGDDGLLFDYLLSEWLSLGSQVTGFLGSGRSTLYFEIIQESGWLMPIIKHIDQVLIDFLCLDRGTITPSLFFKDALNIILNLLQVTTYILVLLSK